MDDDPLSGWGLRPVELADQPTIMPYFASLSQPLSDYTFSQLFSWRNSLRILWTTLHGHLCVFANGTGDLTLLMPPIGDSNTDRALKAAFEIMDDYNAGNGVPDRSRVEYASDELLSRIDRAGMTLQPMGADYVYDVNRMIDLAGGDLASKRQAKNRFMRNYRFRVEAYDPSRHLEECRQLLDSWKIHQDASHLEESNSNAIKRQKESIATDLTLARSHELGLRGIVVHVDGPQAEGLPAVSGIRAFTFGEFLGKDQSSITIEKTDLEIKGLAQFIFSDFCRSHWADRPLVNVGDDWGLESLSWTKMSYRPVKMLQKYTLRKTAVVKVAMPAETKPALVEDLPVPTGVRAAGKDDLLAAVELEKACFSAYPLNKRQLQYLQQRTSAVFLVADQKGAVVGEGIGLVRQHKRALSGRIYSLAVDPDRRGRKIGRQLLEAMIVELSTRGVRKIYLEVEQHNTPAIALYERTGFRHIGVLPDYFGPGKTALHMMREVPVTPSLFDAPLVAR
jgi:ribosomal protein S18 acetylase RimI-like enzyme